MFDGLPPSLAARPNIPWEAQTVEELEAERDYWIARVRDASGFASAKAADDFRKGCEAWITRRRAQAGVTRMGGDAEGGSVAEGHSERLAPPERLWCPECEREREFRCAKSLCLYEETLQAKLRDVTSERDAALARVGEMRAVLDGFRRIAFRPCKTPSCYRPTLTMMQRANAVLCDDEDRAALTPPAYPPEQPL